MKTAEFNYQLPKKLIAQMPASPRDSSRLLVYERKFDKICHDKFFNLKKYLKPGDILVFNNTKVFPARLILQKKTLGKVEIFLLKKIKDNQWECLTRGRLKHSDNLFKDEKKVGQLIKKLENGNWLVKFNLTGKKFDDFLEKYGQTPLPPYIKTKDSKKIKSQYQTIYAKKTGSVAAPTAGLHFTKKLLENLKKFEIQIEFVNLQVGLGTWMPVKSEQIEDHQIHSEEAELNLTTAKRLNEAKKSGRRIIAVGTTTVRVLEAASSHGQLKPMQGAVNLFIYPGYKFKFVDGLITNFHLPQSSLLMLTVAWLSQGRSKSEGVKKIKEIYQKAIQKKYRFYSFGDAMLIF